MTQPQPGNRSVAASPGPGVATGTDWICGSSRIFNEYLNERDISLSSLSVLDQPVGDKLKPYQFCSVNVQASFKTTDASGICKTQNMFVGSNILGNAGFP